MELDKKKWRVNKKDNWPYCDGDCYSWDNGLCTCGLIHHIIYFRDGYIVNEMPLRLQKLEQQHMVAIEKYKDPAWTPRSICDKCGQKYIDELFSELQGD